MAKQPNMKIGIGADTSDFEKGAKQVKQGLKDLSRTGQQSLSSLGDAFGVNTGKVGEMTSAIRGLGAKMTEASNTGVQAFGKLLGSITPLGGAIAGLGLAGAIAGFKQLKSEAENFKSTIDGMNLSMATSAYIATYRQALHDANSDTGKVVAEAMSNWEKGFARFKANVATTFVTAFGQDQKWYDAILPTGFVRAWKQVSENIDEANTKADRAEVLGDQLAEQKKEQIQLDYELKGIDEEIAKLRRDASDRSKTAAEREEARVQYAEKVNEKYDRQKDLTQRIATTQAELTSLTKSAFEATQAMYEGLGKVNEVETARQNELRAIDRLENNIAKSASAAAAAAQKQREEMQKMAEVQARWSGLGSVSTAGLASVQGSVAGPSLSILPQRQDVEYFKETFQAYLGDWEIAIGFKADTEKIHDMTNQVTSLMESSIARTGELIGNLVGTLAGGGDAWGDFKNAALAAFGDMAIAVGKIAISMGLAASGIDVALKDTGQWYIAVAAGAALVALGAAVKSSLSAAASGDYSAAGGGYSGGGYSSGGGGDYETREVKVYVTGTLEADGDKLITVINNTNKKNYYTK